MPYYTWRTRGKARDKTIDLEEKVPAAYRGKEVLISARKQEDMKCVVFTHFIPGTDPQVFDPIEAEKLQRRWAGQLEGYAHCACVDRVFVFIAEAFHAFLSLEATKRPPGEILVRDRRLRDILKGAARETKCVEKVQPILFEDLVEILDALQRRAGRDIRDLFLGSGLHFRYDSPKMVEAFLRIFGRYTGHPVFRVDADAKVNHGALEILLGQYARIPERTAIFAYSGGYGDSGHKRDAQVRWLNDYAVRTFHLAEPRGERPRNWVLDDFKCTEFLRTLSDIGAPQGVEKSGDDRTAQVISGAGLCLSYEAIRKLPPFANLNSLIVWIDDHLKRMMHVAFKDLGENADVSRVEGALFEQDRYPRGLTDAELEYPKVEDYLCRVARGCVFDALIHQKGEPGPYTKRIHDYLVGKYILPPIFSGAVGLTGPNGVSEELTEFGRELVDCANDRIKQVKELWSDPDTGVLSDVILPGSKTCLRRAIGARLQEATLEKGTTRVKNPQESLVYQVVEDAGRYLELLKIWPIFVGLLEGISDGRDWVFDRSPS